jgi:predicted ABC-type ATPase
VPDVIVLGGPNGAGKSTAAPLLLPSLLGVNEFVNADDIARGLSPFNPEGSAVAAGRLMIERIRGLAAAGESFALETTCAGRGHARLLRDCKARGYRVVLLFLWLPSVKAALARVARRVRQGGHGVPAGVVARRYAAGLRNMRRLYLPLADTWMVYDNSDQSAGVIAELRPSGRVVVYDRARWSMIEDATR